LLRAVARLHGLHLFSISPRTATYLYTPHAHSSPVFTRTVCATRATPWFSSVYGCLFWLLPFHNCTRLPSPSSRSLTLRLRVWFRYAELCVTQHLHTFHAHHALPFTTATRSRTPPFAALRTNSFVYHTQPHAPPHRAFYLCANTFHHVRLRAAHTVRTPLPGFFATVFARPHLAHTASPRLHQFGTAPHLDAAVAAPPVPGSVAATAFAVIYRLHATDAHSHALRYAHTFPGSVLVPRRFVCTAALPHAGSYSCHALLRRSFCLSRFRVWTLATALLPCGCLKFSTVSRVWFIFTLVHFHTPFTRGSLHAVYAVHLLVDALPTYVCLRSVTAHHAHCTHWTRLICRLRWSPGYYLHFSKTLIWFAHTAAHATYYLWFGFLSFYAFLYFHRNALPLRRTTFPTVGYTSRFTLLARPFGSRFPFIRLYYRVYRFARSTFVRLVYGSHTFRFGFPGFTAFTRFAAALVCYAFAPHRTPTPVHHFHLCHAHTTGLRFAPRVYVLADIRFLSTFSAFMVCSLPPSFGSTFRGSVTCLDGQFCWDTHVHTPPHATHPVPHFHAVRATAAAWFCCRFLAFTCVHAASRTQPLRISSRLYPHHTHRSHAHYSSKFIYSTSRDSRLPVAVRGFYTLHRLFPFLFLPGFAFHGLPFQRTVFVGFASPGLPAGHAHIRYVPTRCRTHVCCFPSWFSTFLYTAMVPGPFLRWVTHTTRRFTHVSGLSLLSGCIFVLDPSRSRAARTRHHVRAISHCARGTPASPLRFIRTAVHASAPFSFWFTARGFYTVHCFCCIPWFGHFGFARHRFLPRHSRTFTRVSYGLCPFSDLSFAHALHTFALGFTHGFLTFVRFWTYAADCTLHCLLQFIHLGSLHTHAGFTPFSCGLVPYTLPRHRCGFTPLLP